MNEVTLRNESLGLSMTKATINGTDVVLAENVREALEWDSIPNMVRGLKDGKEVLKMRVSALKSEGWNFVKFDKVRSIDPNSIGDNGLGQWHHHPIRSAPLHWWSCTM